MSVIDKNRLSSQKPSWLETPLSEMSIEQWESLCDHCGLCCLHKLEDIDSQELFYTNVACKCLDLTTCQCISYSSRSSVEGCIHLSPEKIKDLSWLPKTCAYRLISEGQELKWWHPLICGTYECVQQAGVSVFGRCVSENDIDMKYIENFIVEWSI